MTARNGNPRADRGGPSSWPVAGSLFVAGVAGGIAVEHLRPEPVAVVADTPVSAAPEPTAAPTTPPATFVADVPDARKVIPPQPPKPVVIDYDARFVSNLKARGWVIWNPASIINNGQIVCSSLRQGMSKWAVMNELVSRGVHDVPGSQQFVETAMGTYPGCG